MPESIGIVFNSGAYGNYLHWMLYTLMRSKEIRSPFTANGTSHSFKSTVVPEDQMLFAHSATVDHIRKNKTVPKLFKCHPKLRPNESLAENMHTILDHTERVRLIYPDRDSYLLTINNYMYKVWNSIWISYLEHINVNDLCKNFNLPIGTALSSISQNMVREYLSKNLFSSWENQVEWFFPDTFNHDRYHTIFVKDLLNSPQTVVDELELFLNVKWIRPFSELITLHQYNLGLQRYINQDRLGHNIMSALDTQSNLNWQSSDLTLVTEAWLQSQIYKHGWSLQCGDTFPTSTTELLEKITF